MNSALPFPRLLLCSLSLLIGSSVAQAQKPSFNLSHESDADYLIQNFRGVISKAKIVDLDPNRVYFHWTKPSNADRWLNQGINDSEFKALLDYSGMSRGGGLYASMDPTNSSGFGSELLGLTFQSGTKMIVPDQHFWSGMESLPELRNALKTYNIDGMIYSYQDSPRAWMVFYDHQHLRNISRPTLDQILTALDPSDPTYALICSWTVIDRAVPLIDTPLLRQKFPVISQLLRGSLTTDEKFQLGLQFNNYPTLMGLEKDISSMMSDDFAHDLWSSRKSLWAEQVIVLAKEKFAGSDIPDFLTFQKHRYVGLKVKSTSFPGIQTRNFPGIFAGETIMQLAMESRQRQFNSFGLKFFVAFAYLDFADLTKAQLEGNPQPWALYDNGGTPLADRVASAKKMISIADFGETALRNVHAELSLNPNEDFRDTPIIASGSHWVEGKSYYRASLAQLAVLQANPFLTVESIPDGDPARRGTSVFVRHEYPSARTFEKFSTSFSAELLNELQQAKARGELEDSNHSNTRSLTRRILKELWASTNRMVGSLGIYSRLVAIHPFLDFNGRTARVVYEALEHRPLILRNWDWDLLLTPDELAFERSAGDTFYNILYYEMRRAQKLNPEYPDYYSAKATLAYFFDLQDRAKIADPQTLTEARKFFADPNVQNAVREKRILEIGSLKDSDCSLQLTARLTE